MARNKLINQFFGPGTISFIIILLITFSILSVLYFRTKFRVFLPEEIKVGNIIKIYGVCTYDCFNALRADVTNIDKFSPKLIIWKPDGTLATRPGSVCNLKNEGKWSDVVLGSPSVSYECAVDQKGVWNVVFEVYVPSTGEVKYREFKTFVPKEPIILSSWAIGVFDKSNNEPISGAKVIIKNADLGVETKDLVGITDSNGKVIFNLVGGKNYIIVVTKEGYVPFPESTKFMPENGGGVNIFLEREIKIETKIETKQCPDGSIVSIISECPEIPKTCESNWQIVSWESCINGYQSAVYEDMNKCEIPTSQKPQKIVQCTIVSENETDNTLGDDTIIIGENITDDNVITLKEFICPDGKTVVNDIENCPKDLSGLTILIISGSILLIIFLVFGLTVIRKRRR